LYLFALKIVIESNPLKANVAVKAEDYPGVSASYYVEERRAALVVENRYDVGAGKRREARQKAMPGVLV